MRPICSQCLRAKRACICALVKPCLSSIELIIWQHPLEVGHPKGSAQLLHLCLPNSRIISAEQLTLEQLQLNSDKCALLYPSSNLDPHSTSAAKEQIEQLLVLDGTWRKTRKLLHINPWLMDLKRIELKSFESNYHIRKADQATQLSTFEAAVLALDSLSDEFEVRELLDVFDAFVKQYQAFILSK